MNRLLDVSRQKEEEKCMVSALSHVITGGGADDSSGARTPPPPPLTLPEQEGYHHHHQPVPVLGGLPEVPLVFSHGESSSVVNKKKKKVKSGKEYRGVRRRGNKWVAEIWDPHQGRVQWLSSFATAEEAARAYDRKAIEYRGVAGAFPYMNFPMEDYGYPPSDNADQTAIAQTVVGPKLSSSTSAGTNKSAPSHSITTGTELPNSINNNITAADQEDDPLLLLDDFDDYTLQQFMDLANSL